MPEGRKRIILLLDGTWNDAEFGQNDTNIVRLREIVSKNLAARGTELKQGAGKGPGDMGAGMAGHTEKPDPSNTKHLVYYLRGVGTGAGLDRYLGGGFGDGVERNVRRAYKFLSFHYAPGDEVFVFGFSRGAFTARSLVGYIASAGLLRREHCTAELEERAWSYYRTPPDDRLPGVWHALDPHVHGRDEGWGQFQVECLGVFDTVGALGVPLTLLRRLNRQLYQFHNVELPSITRHNLHALAIDEHRHPFQAAPWRQHKFKAAGKMTEQVWFAGDHADVGGGHLDEDGREGLGRPALDDVVLDWMLKRVVRHCPGSPFNPPPDILKPVGAGGGRPAPQHDLRRGTYLLWPRNHRSIANRMVETVRSEFFRSEVGAGFQRHESPAEEMVHASALERLGRSVPCGARTCLYAPPGLRAVLPEIAATYGLREPPGEAVPAKEVRVVGWDGEALDPERADHADAARALLQEARDRLERTGYPDALAEAGRPGRPDRG